MALLYTILITVLYTVSIYGWGRMYERLSTERLPFSLTLVLGLATVLAVGGVINLAQVATAPMLDTLALSGCALALYFICQTYVAGRTASTVTTRGNWGALQWVAPTVLITAVMLYTSDTQVPPAALNYHDDLEKYLLFPERMLATGTLRANTLSAIGAETLGGQAWLHGFIAAHWAIGTVNAVDALFGLGLCLLVATTMAWSTRTSKTCLVLFPMLVFAINPNTVNTSSLYTGAALLMVLFALPLYSRRSTEPLPAITVAILYAGLIALKSTYALPVLLHFLIAGSALCVHHRGVRLGSLWCAKVGAWAALFISPWLLVHLPTWRVGLANAVAPNLLSGDDTSRLFAGAPFDWTTGTSGLGTGALHYGALALVILTCVAIVGFRAATLTGRSRESAIVALVGCLVPLACFVVAVFVFGRWLGSEQAIRFVTPVLIAGVPVALATVLGLQAATKSPCRYRRLTNGVAIGLTIGVIALFTPSTGARIAQAYEFGSVLSFSTLAKDPEFARYVQFALSYDTRANIRAFQNNVPPGEPILVSTLTPFHIDFSRNPIVDIQRGGLVTPWMDFPLGAGNDEVRRYLANKHVHYVIWQYRGYGMLGAQTLHALSKGAIPSFRRYGERTLALRQALATLATTATVVADDGFVVALKID